MIFKTALSILLLCCCIHARTIRAISENAEDEVENDELKVNLTVINHEEESSEESSDLSSTSNASNQRRLLYLDDGSHIMKINERRRDTLFQGMVKAFLKGFRWVRELVKLVKEDSKSSN